MSATNLTDSLVNSLSSSISYMKPIDYGVFLAMLMVSMGIGVYFGYFDGKAKTTEEYLLGGRNMQTLPIAISLVARYY